MHERVSFAPALSAAAALGPLALGAVIGAQVGPVTALREAVLIPAIIVGLAVATVPALYIAMVATGSKLTTPTLARAVLRGLEGLGVVLLGIAGPLAFVLSTMQASEFGPRFGVMLGGVGLAVASLLGIQRVRHAIRGHGLEPSVIDAGLFVVWACVALTLGASLYLNLMTTS